MKREQLLDTLRSKKEVSVLVVGAGVNGIGTFRDLAHQGVDVLLIDKADFASGASAASSHMLHGGIRYLENGEFRLVREALTERNLMLRNAPHYAKPLPTTIPIFNIFSGLFNAPLKFLRLRDKPAERGALVIKLGLIMYDLFARAYKVMPNHSLLLKEKALQTYKHINPDIFCVARYYDSFMPYPERICMELIEDGLNASSSALALNYVSLAGNNHDTVTLRDELTGETFVIKPKIVVNAAGPWIDFANDAIGKKTHYIGGTKGSHLIIDHPELYQATGGTEIFFENKDGRIVLILPYVDGKVMIGTTDIRIDNPDDAVCTDAEIDYFLDMIERVFPGLKVDRSHIVFSFSGVRPLVSSEAGFTGNVSRDHHIKIDEPNESVRFPVYSLIGGKWTTYRAFAEQTADVVLARLGTPRRTSTASMKLGGGVNYPQDDAAKNAWFKALNERTGVSLDRLNILFERYGTRAADIAEFMARGDNDAPLAAKPDYTRRELAYLIQTEQVTRLDDLILRRTLMAWLGGFTEAVLNEVADVAASELGWSADRKREEIARTAHILTGRHHVKLAVTA